MINSNTVVGTADLIKRDTYRAAGTADLGLLFTAGLDIGTWLPLDSDLWQTVLGWSCLQCHTTTWIDGETYCDCRWEERYEEPATCGREFGPVGPADDPYGSACDLPVRHTGRHQGPDPFGDGRVAWSGGGSVAGDRLPITNIEHLPLRRGVDLGRSGVHVPVIDYAFRADWTAKVFGAES